VERNRALLSDMGALAGTGQVADAILRYAAYLEDRNGTYMEYARPGHGAARTRFTDAPEALAWLEGQIGGYAEVALDVLAGRSGAGPRLMALNIPSRGTLPGLEPGDVIETDCMVDERGVTPRPHEPLPEQDLALLTRVKEYERLAVRAIRDRSQALAVDALVTHPLVGDRTLAEHLIARLGILRD
jgi:6-phospho-beta-glucosidase